MFEPRRRVAALPPTVGIKDPAMRQFADALVSAWGVRNDGSGPDSERFVRRGEINQVAADAVVQALSGAASPGSVAMVGDSQIDYSRVLNAVSTLVRSSKVFDYLNAPITPVAVPSGRIQELLNRIDTESQARFAALTNEADARIAAIANEAAARGVTDASLQSQVNTIIAAGTSDTSTILAALQDEQTARVDGDTAEASARSTLAVQMRGAYTGTDPAVLTQGLMFNERTARISADSAIVTSANALSARVGANESGLVNEATARANADSAAALTVASLNSRVGVAEGAIVEERNTRVSKDNALAQALNTIWASVGGAAALIQDGQLAAVSPAAVAATKWTQLQAAVTDPNTGLVSTSSIKEDLNVYASKVDGTLNSAWGIKSDVNGFISGLSLMTSAGAGSAPGAGTSEFMIMANRLSLVNPSNTGIRSVPFSVDGSGNATFAGWIYAAGGTFGGALAAASGTFAGALTAATGTFAGSLTAQVVNTENIVGAAVSTVYSAQASGKTVSVTVSIPPQARSLVVIGFFGKNEVFTYYGAGTKNQTSSVNRGPASGTINSPLGSSSADGSTAVVVANPPAGNFTFTATRAKSSDIYNFEYYLGNISIICILVKR